METKKNWGASWNLSPDGSSLAIIHFGEGRRLRILPLTDRVARDVPVKDWKGWGNLQSVTWSRDGQRLYVTGWSGSESGLISVDLGGEVQVLWRWPAWVANPAVSPDGRRLAIQAATSEGNVWLIEGLK